MLLAMLCCAKECNVLCAELCYALNNECYSVFCIPKPCALYFDLMLQILIDHHGEKQQK